MGKHVTSKALTKRVRTTKNGKQLRRPLGVNHFKTRKSNRNLRDKRKGRSIHGSDAKNIATY